MYKPVHILILFFVLAGNLNCFSQKTLEIVYTRFGKLKKYEIHNGEVLDYKLKGQLTYHRNKITNLQDSFIVFSNDTIIKLNELKAVCIHRSNFVIRLFQSAFITGGAFFFFLNTTNNLINSREPVIDPKAILIGAGLVTTGILIKQLGVKRIRINKHKQLKIVDLDFNNLSEKPEK
ncbi:MAG: hypothetical protein ABIP51_14365 [Bacteroidia bacterium]